MHSGLKESSEIEDDDLSADAADPNSGARKDTENGQTTNENKIQDDDASSIYNAEANSIDNFCNNLVDEGWIESDSGEEEEDA